MKRKFPLTITVILSALFILSGCNDAVNESISISSHLIVQEVKDGSWSIIDENGEYVVKDEYPSDNQFSYIFGETFWVYDGGKYQLFNINSPKKAVTDSQWDYATNMIDNRALVANAGSPIQIIDEKGKVITTLSKDIVRVFRFQTSHFSFVKSDGTQGWADKDGKIIKEGLYGIFICNGEIAAIASKKKDLKEYSIFDKNGKETGTFTDEENTNIASDGYVVVQKNSKSILLDSKGKPVFETRKYKNILSPSKGYCITQNSDDDKGAINLKGEEVIRTKYKSLKAIDGDVFMCVKDNKLGIVDASDETIIDFNYESGMPLGKNFILKDGTWIVIGRDGKRIGKNDFYETVNSKIETFINYINVDAITENLISYFSQYNSDITLPQIAKKLKLQPSEEYTRTNILSEEKESAGLKTKIEYAFDYCLCDEKYHTVTTNDGWFDHQERVSDGYVWRVYNIHSIYVTYLDINQNIEQLRDILLNNLKNKGYEKTDNGDYTLKKGNNYLQLMIEDEKLKVMIFNYDNEIV